MNSHVLTELGPALVSGSMTDEQLLARTSSNAAVTILPDANVIKIGGQSVIDRGRAAVFPILDEVVDNLPRHKMIIATGAGTRARHAYSVGLDLGMPTGVLGVLGTFVSMQNARMIHYLLARHGIPFIEPAQFAQLPLYRRNAVPPCSSACLPTPIGIKTQRSVGYRRTAPTPGHISSARCSGHAR
jgi:molybdenum storage protein